MDASGARSLRERGPLMPAEFRRVTIAPGHVVSVRRSRIQNPAPGKVAVEKSRGRRFETPAAVWEAGAPR